MRTFTSNAPSSIGLGQARWMTFWSDEETRKFGNNRRAHMRRYHSVRTVRALAERRMKLRLATFGLAQHAMMLPVSSTADGNSRFARHTHCE